MKRTLRTLVVLFLVATLPAYSLSLPRVSYSFALPTATTWETRPTNGLDTNGGAFVAGATGTDFSQQNSPQVTFTDLIIGATTTQLTSVLNPFSATSPGNVINITGGTGCTTGRYSVSSVATATATMDRSVGTAASTCTGFLGGALQTLTQLNSSMVEGNTAWVKAEATITTSGGLVFNFTNASTNEFPAIQGYTSTRGDMGQVTIQLTGAATTTVRMDTLGLTLANFLIDCNSQASSNGLNFNNGTGRAYNLKVQNCTGVYGVQFTAGTAMCIRCTVTGQSGGGAVGGFVLQNNGVADCVYCVATDGTVPGFAGSTSVGIFCVFCIAGNNSGATTDGFFIQAFQNQNQFWHSFAYKNGRDGFRLISNNFGNAQIFNSISYGNGGFGINYTNGLLPFGTQLFDYNGLGANTGGNYNNLSAGAHDVSLSADPTVAGGSDNFALNSTAGGGAALKAVGFPGALTGAGTGFVDIGPLQSAAGGGSSVTVGYPTVQ
jgi:hypothetical protein